MKDKFLHEELTILESHSRQLAILHDDIESIIKCVKQLDKRASKVEELLHEFYVKLCKDNREEFN